MSDSKQIRIGFIGVGNMGQAAHLRNYAALPECEVVALAEIREKTARLVAERFGIPRVYSTHQELLANEELDGVVACQPFDTYAALLPEIYGKVRHVFTEKPLAVSVTAAERLAAQAEETGTVHMVGYHKRSDPATAWARKTMDEWRASGRMGALRYVRITMPAGDWTANGLLGVLNAGDAPGRSIPRESPELTDLPGVEAGTSGWKWGGAAGEYVRFVNYYIHQVNFMRYVLGEPYRVTYADPSGVLLAVQSQSGIPGTIEMSPYTTSVDWHESILIAFEKGYIRIDLPAPLAVNRPGQVEIYADPRDGTAPECRKPSLPWIHAMRQQAANFVAVCRGEMMPPCTAAEAVDDLRVARDYIRLWKGLQQVEYRDS